MSDVVDNLHPTLRDLPGTTVVDRYRVDAVLGIGGMGAVFSGRHLGLERDVAIKILHPELTRDPEISKRFDREAHSASRLDHPNCLRVTDVGSTDDGLKFMVMDLLAGSELADSLGDPIAPDRAALLMIQVLRGLEHAHENGVIHRDIKPENVFVTRDHDGREVLKLVDFGIAKLVGGGAADRMTKAGLIFGTPAYMSPEQAMGMEADARADIYSVGIILYEMLRGAPPFASEDPVKLVRMQVSKEPPPLPESIAAPLVAVVTKLLEKDRDARYQSATEARLALEAVLPSIASTDVHSGATLHGSSVTGPILINTAVSGPIGVAASGTSDVAMLRTREPSGHGGVSLPTLPPQPNALHKRSNRKPLVIGGIALAALAGVWVASGGDESEAPDAETKVTISGEPAGAGAAVAAEGDGAPGPDADRLADVDRLILANKVDDAQKLLQPLLDDYPDNALLAWRQGQIFVKSRKRKNRAKALASYGDAVDADPALLENHEFYAELHALLSDSKLRQEALDFALRKMGSFGHKFLLELVNDERDPMGYSDRRRALTELSTVEDNGNLVNWQLHRALDLLQATEALRPCTAYGDALESIADDPDFWYLPRVERADIPSAKTGDGLTEDELADAEHCEGLSERRDEVVALLRPLGPEPEDSDGEVVIDDDDEDEDASDADAAPKKSGSKRKRPAGCNRPFGFLKKQCQ